MAQNLLLPDFVGGALRYAQAGDQLRRNEQLAGLSSQAYSAETPEAQKSLLSQMAAVNPAAAQQQKAAFQSDEDRRFSRLSNAARYLERARQSGNPAQLQGAWNAVRPMLQREVPQANYPEQWDDATMAPVLYEALARTGGVGGQVQSTKIGEDGFYWTVDRAGNWTNSGIRANPNIRVLEQEGTVPYGVVTSGGVAGSIVPLGGGGNNAAMAGSGGNAARVAIDGIPAEQQQRMAQTISLMRQAGYPDTEIDAFVAGQASMPRDVSSLGGVSQVQGGPVRTPTSAETAAAKRLAETNVDLATADARARAEAQIAGQREAAVQDARVEAERAEQAPVRREAFRQMVAKTGAVGGAIDRALSQVDWSTSGPIGSFMSNLPGSDAYDLRATIDTIKANLAFDTLQQMRAASPTGGALGAVSERELRLLESAVASLDQAQSGAQLRQAMQTIKQHYQEWRRSAEAAFQQAQSGRQGSSQQPSGWGIQRVD